MDPESKKLLEETYQLVKDNNEMLHKVRTVQKWATFWHTLKVLVIVGVALGAFYFLQPYIDGVVNFYSSISGAKTTEKAPENSSFFQDLLKKF